MKEKTSKICYPICILLMTINAVLPVFMIVVIIYNYFNPIWVNETKDGFGNITDSSSSSLAVCILTVLTIISFLQYVFFKDKLKRWYNSIIQSTEYDEFGRSKKHSYENLTRKQREEMDLKKTADMELLLSTSVIKKITKKGSVCPEKDMENLIGLYSVKQKMKEMVARMKFEKEAGNDAKLSFSGRHLCFYGSAGTGKTTVARIMTGFLYQYGYIKKNKCVEIDGNFLKCGLSTADKTKLVIESAYDGVLFIDEAYALTSGSDGCGEVALATLIKEMEDKRDRFVLIIAGYRKEMEKLLDANTGFSSRIKEYLDFADYGISEMSEIFRLMANEHNLTVDTDAMENFEIRILKEQKEKNFGNARTVRNVLDESIDRHALNYSEKLLSDDKKFVLASIDISTQVKR